MSDTRNAGANAQTDMVETLNFEAIKGYPMLQWRGKRPFTSTHFYPAQLKEQHGSDVEGWLNKIYWGDNLQVMSHLLKNYRGKVELVYIDPPFDSKTDYKKKIQLRGKQFTNDQSVFEEKQYTDIWNNDEYLQFIYERLILLRELMSDTGSIFVHCDWHKSHYLRCILEELFGIDNLVNEIVWQRTSAGKSSTNNLPKNTDTIFWFSKTQKFTFNNVSVPLSEKDIASFTKDDNDDKGPYNTQPIISPNFRENLVYTYTNNSGDVFTSPKNGWRFNKERMKQFEEANRLVFTEKGIREKNYLSERLLKGKQISNLWADISGNTTSYSSESLDYPTQKPTAILERIILAASEPNDLVFDCFMGSGTAQAVSMKLGRRFLGADINLGAVQISTKRLLNSADRIQVTLKTASAKLAKAQNPLFDATSEFLSDDIEDDEFPAKKAKEPTNFYTGFEVYNVNNYDIFRNPIEAKDLLIEALELQKLQAGHLFDGERDGRMWKIMPINKIATRQDLNEIITGLNLRALADRLNATPNQPAEKITLVCMGHEPDLAATLNQEVALSLNVKAGTKVPLDVQVFDILRDRGDIQFKRDAEAKVSIKGGQLVIEAFYPMNLLSKLSLEKEKVGDWREMVDSVMVDFNYDGAVFNPTLLDIPEKNALVSGSYTIPDDAGTIRVKITDVLSESLEIELHG